MDTAFGGQIDDRRREWLEAGRLEGWKGGSRKAEGMEGWKQEGWRDGRLEAGRLEGWGTLDGVEGKRNNAV